MRLRREVDTDGLYSASLARGGSWGVALVLLDLWLFFVAWPPREYSTQSGYKSSASFDHVLIMNTEVIRSLSPVLV